MSVINEVYQIHKKYSRIDFGSNMSVADMHRHKDILVIVTSELETKTFMSHSKLADEMVEKFMSIGTSSNDSLRIIELGKTMFTIGVDY